MKRVSLNNLQIESARCLCLGRDGYSCKICKNKFYSNIVAEIHHVDGNPNNNPEDGSNWQLVHKSCNMVQYYVSKRIEAIDGERAPPFEYSVGTRMELSWLRWVIDEISTKGKISWSEARYTGALEAECSPETTRRYLMKHVVNSDHPKAMFMSTLDKGYESEIKFTSQMQAFSEQYIQYT